MNSALAKLQYLSNQSEFVFAGDNGNPRFKPAQILQLGCAEAKITIYPSGLRKPIKPTEAH